MMINDDERQIGQAGFNSARVIDLELINIIKMSHN